MTVGGGDSGCMNSNSPSTTQGPAAGALTTFPPGSGGGTVIGSPLATGQGGSGQRGNTATSTSHVGPIVGGVVGGVLGLLVLAVLGFILFRLTAKEEKEEREKPDLLEPPPVSQVEGRWAREAPVLPPLALSTHPSAPSTAGATEGPTNPAPAGGLLFPTPTPYPYTPSATSTAGGAAAGADAALAAMVASSDPKKRHDGEGEHSGGRGRRVYWVQH
ncbi:hypothetical protein DACRYDRAFT_22062, partial [Dacryopinax primogenitus]